MESKKIKGGVYLVIDPQIEEAILINKLQEILDKSQIAAVQVWDNFKDTENPVTTINKICSLCHTKNLPVLLNNSWEILKLTNADGVHFDEIPKAYKKIKKSLPENSIIGLTCNNDLEIIKWADKNKLDYVSFCSVFSSSTSNSCELVDFRNIEKARSLTRMPIFLAGGIKPENMQLLKELDFDGIAVISGIMNAANPSISAENYNLEFKKIKNENFNNK